MEKHKISLKDKTILVTGSPGFIGANLVKRLIKDNEVATVVSVDNLNEYYDLNLKMHRLEEIEKIAAKKKHIFLRGSISDKTFINRIFNELKPDIVVNLAAQAGVRYSIENPNAYIDSNITGFFNILEACRNHPVEHLVFASSSSVYGGNTKVPFSTDHNVDHPVSLYAATKKSNELMAHSYAKLYDIPVTGLRFFTVYGPAGRPDMFYFSAAEKLKNDQKIKVFNHGDMIRDFTYVDDIVEGIVRVMKGAPEKKTGEDGLPIPPYAIYNIGGGQPENLLDFIETLGEELVGAGVLPEGFDMDSHIIFEDMQPGDVPITYADTKSLEEDFGFVPGTKIRDGLRAFSEWFAKYYK